MEAHLDQAKHLFFNLVGGDKSGKNTWADDAGADDASIPDGPPLWQHPTFVDMYGRPFTTSHYASEAGSSDPIANQLNSGAADLMLEMRNHFAARSRIRTCDPHWHGALLSSVDVITT